MTTNGIWSLRCPIAEIGAEPISYHLGCRAYGICIQSSYLLGCSRYGIQITIHFSIQSSCICWPLPYHYKLGRHPDRQFWLLDDLQAATAAHIILTQTFVGQGAHYPCLILPAASREILLSQVKKISYDILQKIPVPTYSQVGAPSRCQILAGEISC